MQRTLSIAAAALFASAALVGCSDSKDGQPGTSGLLSVELHASQEGVAAEKTRAAYGFSVNELGAYRVGPGPAGETLEGFVSPAELGKLMAAVNGSESAATTTEAEGEAEAPTSITELVTGKEYVIVSRGGAMISKTSASSTEFHPGAATRAQGEALHRAIRDLAAAYYPDEFPGACATATANLIKLYPAAKACKQDADCGYVHWDFTAAEGEQYVSTDICKWSRPMVAANLSAVEASYQALVDAFNAAEDACAQRTDCTRGHVLTTAAAVCAAGVCKANPTLSY